MVKRQAVGRIENGSSSAQKGEALRRLESSELLAIISGVRAHIITGGKESDDDGIG